jgi:amino acid adenylation domain-containing protein
MRGQQTEPTPAASLGAERRLTELEIASLIRAHYRLQQGQFISECQESKDWILVLSKVSPVPMWNHGAWVSTELGPATKGRNDGAFDGFLDEMMAPRSVPRRPTVYLNSDCPSGSTAREVLSQRGFEECEQESWMIFTHPERLGSEDGSGLEIRLAQSEREIAEFAKVFYAAFQARGEGYAQAFQKESREPARAVSNYVAYDEAKAVCIASVIVQDGEAGIYNVGTLPEARRKGYAARLLAALIPPLLDRRVFLQVARGSKAEQLYSRLGFETCFARVAYRLAEWSPPRVSIPSGDGDARAPLAFLESIRSEPAASRPGESGVAVESLPLPAGLSAKIERLAGRLALPSGVFWAGAWACLLSRYSHEVKVGFGIRLPGDGEREPVPFWIEVDERKSKSDWLSELREQMYLEEQSPRDARNGGQFESVIDLDPSNDRDRARRVSPLEWRLTRGGTDCIEFLYERQLFEEGSIGRLAGHLFALLESMAEEKELTLAELEILTRQEKCQLLTEWNRQPQGRECELLPELFEMEAGRSPGSLAVMMASREPAGEQGDLTYEELNRRANRLAHYLRKRGVGPEVKVGLCLDRSLELIVSLLAVFKARGVCLPLDPAYPAERLSYMLEDGEAAVVLTQRSALDVLPKGRAGVICLESAKDEISCQPEVNLDMPVAPGQAAYVIYTSGSTGRPKGVVITNGAIASHCLETREGYGLGPEDRVLQFNSINFDAAFEQIFSTLISGATLVLRGPEVWSPKELARVITAWRLTVVDLPTAYWHQVLTEWTRDRTIQPAVPPRLFIVGGEAMQPESLRLWRELSLSKTRLLNAYGPTETTITATVFEVTPAVLAAEGPRRVPIGKPRGERTLHILDQLGRLVPVGVTGELHIGGPLLARGYLNQPELTREKFVLDPFSGHGGARLYKTGDLGRFLRDGNVEFLGRVDDQVKIRGYRVELGEIAAALHKHPKVREAAVILRTATPGENRLVAYVVAGREPWPDESELRRHLQQSLPDYMLPAAFVFLPSLPLLPSGKVDRRALPAPPERASETAVAGPQDPVELRLQLLFERVLRQCPVPVDRSFFELGGDSLQALELIVEVERISGHELGLETLYQSPTVESLAGFLRKAAAHEWSSLVPLQTGGTRPPLFFIHTTPGDILGYGNLIYHLDRGQPCYGFQSLGFYKTELSHTRIEEMAAYYISLMRGFQKEGPYYLAGWCYGGIVALEMAQQLKAIGQEVAFLGQMETVAPAPSIAVSRYYLHRLGCLLRMKPADWRGYLREKLRYRREVKMANKLRFRRAEQAEQPDQALFEERNRKLDTLEHVYNTNMRALDLYRPRPYAGRVTLFNAEETDPAMLRDPLYAWPGLAAEIEVHTVPGKHDTMLMEPHVAVLARKLEEALRQAQGTQMKGQRDPDRAPRAQKIPLVPGAQ